MGKGKKGAAEEKGRMQILAGKERRRRENRNQEGNMGGMQKEEYGGC